MLYNNIIAPYIQQTAQNPDQTAARIDGQVYSYAQLAQRIAPIMNELDAMSIDKAGLVMKPDLTACAALLACLFSGITVVPLSPGLTDSERDRIAGELQLPQTLTVERMHYYFRMTFEDALCRIDNGLYHIEDETLVCLQYHFGTSGEITFRPVFAKDFQRQKKFSLASVFQQLTPDFPEICSIF